MMSAYPPRHVPMQPAYYRNQPAVQGSMGPPLDDQEHWFIQPTPNNRMILALQCGILSEVAWALSRMLRLTASDRFNLSHYSLLPDVVCEWPEWFLRHADDEDSINFSPSADYSIKRRLALNSLLVLKNICLSEEAATTVAKLQRVRNLIRKTLENFQIANDSTQEFLLMAMDIFRLTVQFYPSAPDQEQVATLIDIVGQSNDRAVLIAGLLGLHNLLEHFTSSMHVTPTSPSLNTAIRLLPLTLDRDLAGAALDYMLAHLSHPSLAKAFLHHPDMPQVLRLLGAQLLWDQKGVTDVTTVLIGAEPATAIAPNNAIGVVELTEREKNELGVQAEPERCTQWMKLIFEVSPRAEVTQVEFWTLYKAAFSSYEPAMLPAADLIKLVTTIFPSTQALVVNGADGKASKFIIRGIDRRRSTAENRTKCRWDEWGCIEPAFSSPAALLSHVMTHITPNSTRKCLWGNCGREFSSHAAFMAHLATHLPLMTPVARHAGQVDDVMVPSNAEVNTPTPTARPIPPGLQTTFRYIKPREDPPPTSFTALLIMRILFRTSFIAGEVVMKTDNDHFGFPGVEQGTGDGEEITGLIMNDLGYDEIEGQRKGIAAFRSLGNILSGIHIHDGAIASWIEEMLDTIRSQPNVTL